ncbi:MAG TPA: hypothetical protein VKQ89_03500 [Candidatus Angelobacter sp.]|nr:hypothetical protein [Candidatus Angelobacter sp.]
MGIATLYQRVINRLASRAGFAGRRSHKSRNPRRIYLGGLVLLIGAAALGTAILALQPAPANAQSIPTNASGGCPVPAATFNSWFQSGTPALNGVVNPADSLAFSPTSLCSFYQWSEQMFLWLLSPAPSSYGGGAHIFDSPTFFDVSPLNASDQRTMTKHVSGRFPIIGVRVPIPGPHGLPMILDKNHRLFEVAPAKVAPSGKPLILNRLGKEVEVGSATIANGKVLFKDAAGKMITAPRPILRPELLKPATPLKLAPRAVPQARSKLALKPAAPQAMKPQIAQRFMINNRPIIINPFGGLVTPVNPEEGQATFDALLSQGNSLVYYTIVVNDVYAYFLTGNKTGGITPAATEFPTTSADLAKVTAFASSKGVTFPDPNALAVEVKMSWVDASTLSNSANYVTVSATVPTYNTSNPSQWVPTGTKNITLALVGVHFVATTLGHPEMIWASFEHFGNTPNASYTYLSTSGNKTVPQDSAGNWLFCVPNCPTGSSFNQSHAKLSGNDIVGNPAGASITPSNTLRTNPWGLPGTAAGSVSSNTQIVSINNSVLSQLIAGDMRKNYFMLGATWTINGQPPTPSGVQVGTNVLANSTMETYVQGVTNCFSCHDNNGVANGMLGINADSGLSHIYAPIQPLP